MPLNKTPSGIILPTFPERYITTKSGKTKKVEYKIISGELKATNDDQGIVEGYLNVIGNVDFGNDRTKSGAFKRTLDLSYKRKKANNYEFLWPYLWNHDVNLLPAGGIFDADEDQKGLFIKARLNLDLQLGREMYSSYKFGSLHKQSMGYIAHKVDWVREDGENIRDLVEIEVLEGSSVLFPMNDLADVTNVKSVFDGLGSIMREFKAASEGNSTKLSPEEVEKLIAISLERGKEPARIDPDRMDKFTWQVGDLVPVDGDDEEDEEDEEDDDDHAGQKHGNHDQSTHGRRRNFNAKPQDEPALHNELSEGSAKKWLGSISEEQKDGITTYTGSAYKKINRALRNGEKVPDDLQKSVLDAQAGLLQSKIPEDMTLTRYTSSDLIMQMKEGKYFVDHGFMSTSISDKASGSFGDMKMTISAFKGAPGGYVPAISEYYHEKEFLLPPNAQLKITKITKDEYGVPHVFAEYRGRSKAMKEPAIDENGIPTWTKKAKKWIFNLGMSTKAITGNTGLPIGPRDESWDSDKAEKQIFAYAEKDDGTFDTSKLKQCFMVQDGDPQQKGSWSYPFCYVINNKPRISVGAVIAIAAAIQGARNANPPDGLKSKVETLYNRINNQYTDDPQLTPPWENGKSSRRSMNKKYFKEKKTVQEHYAEEMCEDLLEDWQDVFVCALTCALLDAFKIGDQPEQDISAALDDFKQLVLTKFVPEAIECNLSQYLTDNAYSSSDDVMQNGSSYYGYMSSNRQRSSKAGKPISAANMQKIDDHVKSIKAIAKKAKAAMQDHVNAMHDHADDMVSDLAGGNSKTLLSKHGRVISANTAQAIKDYASTMHDHADKAMDIMHEHVKALRSAADDFANTIQGSEQPYAGNDPGEPDDDQQESKGRNAISSTKTHSATTYSPKSTADEEKTITETIDDLRRLRFSLI